MGSELATEEAAALVLSPAERAVWERANHAPRNEMLRYRTSKEACLKARGWGLEPPLREIAVSADAPDYLAALAV
ncbi:MAG: hypothetical protein ACREHF_04405 [Rhizomicrobium sp.]